MARERRYDDEDDDDDRPVKKKELSGLDALYTNYFVILVIASVCCNACFLIPLILSLIEFFTGTDTKAKSNAKICMLISIVMIAIGVVVNIISMMTGGGAAFKFK